MRWVGQPWHRVTRWLSFCLDFSLFCVCKYKTMKLYMKLPLLAYTVAGAVAAFLLKIRESLAKRLGRKNEFEDDVIEDIMEELQGDVIEEVTQNLVIAEVAPILVEDN